MQRNITHRLLIVLGLLVLYVLGIGVRWSVLEAQHDRAGFRVPFTLESALEFRLVEKVYDEGRLPEVDGDVQYPEGVVVRETYSVGAERVYAALARLLPSGMELGERVRRIEVAWFCLGIPFLVLWIRWATGSRLAGAAAGAFYAVALSSVMRSTGQELSRENFALPLLIAHLACDAYARRAATGRSFWTGTVASALLLALAVCTWDLMQFYVILWALVGYVKVVRGDIEREEGWRWAAQWCGLVLACLFNPYLKAHGWVQSPAMLISYGVLIGWGARRGLGKKLRARRLAIAVVAVLPLVLGVVLAAAYREAYAHFAELLLAKIRFLNRKPGEPSLLTFSQRIMWVPALHSATWRLTWAIFPAMLPLTLMAAGVLSFRHRARPDTGFFQLLFFYSASLVAFCFFVRFHVFLALFAAGLLGWWIREAASHRGWRRWVVIAVLATGWVVEAGHVLHEPERWGRSGVYYQELEEMVEWVKEHTVRGPVLANFGASASVLAYGDRPIIIHPKFESREIRRRVQEYGEALFKGTEREFRDWAAAHGARYYVHGVGEFSEVGVPYQMRYAVDAVEPPADSAARVFEFRPEGAEHFQYLWGNVKYRVFRVLPPEDKDAAAEENRKAEEALRQGDLQRAEQCATRSLELDPENARALDVMRHVGSLRDQGFSYEGQESDGEE